MHDKLAQRPAAKSTDSPQYTLPEHVIFLDGIRGAAALYVVLFHLSTVLPRPELAAWAQRITSPFTQGHLAVGVFIVLSGYLLMLAPARSDAYELRGGLRTFLTRRARRILPPYYAALVFSLPTDLYRQHIHGETFLPSALLSHLFMVHNLSLDWVWTINSPLWSVAVEFQIYLLFPLVLLPVCRRWGGIGAAVVCAWILGLLPIVLLPTNYNLAWSCPWYLGLFAFGMTGAVITQRGNSLAWTKAAMRFPWMLVVIPCFASSVFLDWNIPYPFLFRDTLLGIATMATIVCGVQSLQQKSTRGAGRIITRVFGSPLMTGLGAFSYSLYLTHFPLLSVLDTMFKRFNGNPMALAAYQLAFVFPVVLIAAYFFYRCFEKPFVHSRATAREPFTRDLTELTPKSKKVS